MHLSIRDVSGCMGVSEKTVNRWIKQDGLPFCRINDQARFNRAELLEWATSRRMNVPLQLFYEAAGEPELLPSLADALAEGGVFYRVQGSDKPVLLRSIAACIPLPPGVDRDLMLRMLLAREALESTGIGEGIAIPHPRNPIVLYVPRPLVTLCFPVKPVNFAALDGQPVFALFTLISPAPKVHLQMLARLLHAIRQPDFKALLLGRAPAGEIQEAIRKIEDKIPCQAAVAGEKST